MTISLTGFLLNFRDTTLADADSAEQHGRIIKAMGGRGKGSSTVDDYHAGSHPTCALVLTDRPRHDRTAYRRGFLPPVKVIGGHRDFCRPCPCRVGHHSTGHATRTIAVLH